MVQRLEFSRFQGLSRLTNWFYNAEELRLLDLETRTRNSLQGLLDFVRTAANPPKLGSQLTDLVSEFNDVSGRRVEADDYAGAATTLRRIFNTADRLSVSLARYDIPLGESFNVSQETALKDYGLGAESSLADVLGEVHELARRQALDDLPAVREILDVLGQWVSDAMIKVPKLRDDAVPLKAAILAAGATAQQAYLLAFVRRDHEAARTAYLKALLALEGVDVDLVGALAEASIGLAKPKLREASTKPYDTASMMLARAFVEDGFLPDLVVGLPTGGVHAATRVVASLTILTGKAPILWATRPQGVKEESQKFMKGARKQDILSPAEVKWLRLHKVRTVAIVDDGFQSGGTLVLARDIYAEALKAEVKTGVIEASTRQMGAQVDVGEEEERKMVSNPADYVAVAGVGAAGPTGVLEKVFNEQDVKSNTDPSFRGTSGIVTSKEAVKLIKVGDLLDV